MNEALHKKRMSRKAFEAYFAGEWKEVRGVGGYYRENGKFKTRKLDGWKLLEGPGWKIRGKTWAQIAASLKLGS